MAQSKSFFGLRKGSTKSLTFQVLNGKQITKDRVYNVKNPQTIAQMQQRAMMATAISAYSTLKVICDHSFEGFEVGSKSMGEFIRINIAKLKQQMPAINVSEYKSGNFVFNNYIVSSGSLNGLVMNETSTGGEENYDRYSTGVTATENMTFGNLAEACGLKQNGMITFMVVNTGQAYWLRIKFISEVWDEKINFETNFIDQLININVNSVEGDNVVLKDDITLVKSTNDKSILKFNVSKLEDEMSACILSQKSEGKWRRSTSVLYGAFDTNFERDFSSYPINTTLLLNGGKMPSNVIKK